MQIEPIAHIRTEFPTKFGVPRQSGLVANLEATIVFEPDYRNPDALRGIGGFSHLWLIWGFSENERAQWLPLVRPPRLGGNEKMGVFATRSPFRPNGLGLSSVVLDEFIPRSDVGPVVRVKGADLMDMTPIYDIKPYIPYTDVHGQAICGFAPDPTENLLQVSCPQDILDVLGGDAVGLLEVLALDPRPAYHNDPERIYGMGFSTWDVKFRVDGMTLTVLKVAPRQG